MTMLKVEGLSAGYGKLEVVKDVSFQVNTGEFVGLVGLNGSGKSTIILAIAGLLTSSYASCIKLGDIRLDSLDAASRARAGLGIVFQKAGVFKEMTIKQNLELAIGKGFRAAQPFSVGDLGEAWSKLLGRENTLAGALSGGEQRLLSLGMILARRPRALLADEPTLGIWHEFIPQVFTELKLYARNTNSAVLTVSHDWDQLGESCHRNYFISNGKLSFVWNDKNELMEWLKGPGV